MEKKNNLVLTIVAVATLLVAVVGATYAYFASNTTVNAALNVNVTTEASNKVFTATGGGDISFSITAAQMSAENKGQYVSDNKIITVTYTNDAATKTSCTYNIKYTWNASNSYGTGNAGSAARGSAVEFGYIITASNDKAANANSNATENKATSVSSVTQIPATTGNIITSDKVTSSSAIGKVTATYKIEMRFYNLTTDQKDLGGKTFGGKWTVDGVNCQ